MSIFDTIGSLLGKSDNSPMSVPEAQARAQGDKPAYGKSCGS